MTTIQPKSLKISRLSISIIYFSRKYIPPTIKSPASDIFELTINKSERFENFSFETAVITTVFNNINETTTSIFQCIPIAIIARTIVEAKNAFLGVVKIDIKIV